MLEALLRIALLLALVFPRADVAASIPLLMPKSVESFSRTLKTS